MKLHFQFAVQASEAARGRVEGKLRALGVKRVKPLFEAESDPELAAMRVVEDGSEEVLAYLAKEPEVAFAERAAERKLG